MFVTFDRVRERIRLVLKKDDLDPERKGTQHDNIRRVSSGPHQAPPGRSPEWTTHRRH